MTNLAPRDRTFKEVVPGLSVSVPLCPICRAAMYPKSYYLWRIGSVPVQTYCLECATKMSDMIWEAFERSTVRNTVY